MSPPLALASVTGPSHHYREVAFRFKEGSDYELTAFSGTFASPKATPDQRFRGNVARTRNAC